MPPPDSTWIVPTVEDLDRAETNARNLAQQEEGDVTVENPDGTQTDTGKPSAWKSAQDAGVAAVAALQHRDFVRGAYGGASTPSAVRAADLAFHLRAANAQTSIVGTAEAGSSTPGWGDSIGAVPNGLTWVGCRFKITGGSAVGMYVTVYRREGQVNPALMTLVTEHLFPITPGIVSGEYWFEGTLPFRVWFEDNPEFFVTFALVGAVGRPFVAAGDGYWTQTVPGAPSTNPGGSVVAGSSVEIRYDLHRQSDGSGSNGELRVTATGQRALSRFTRQPTAAEVEILKEALWPYFRLEPEEVAGSAVETMPEGNATFDLTARRLASTQIDVSAPSRLNWTRAKFRQPTAGPLARRVRLVGLREHIDGRAGVAFDLHRPVGGLAGEDVTISLHGEVKGPLDSVFTGALHVLCIADEGVHWYGAGKPGFRSYRGVSEKAIDADRPWDYLQSGFTDNAALWLRISLADALVPKSLVGLGEDVPARTHGDSMSRVWYKFARKREYGELFKALVIAIRGNSLMSDRSAIPQRTRLVEALGGETFEAATSVSSMTHDGAPVGTCKLVTVVCADHGYQTGDWVRISGSNEGRYNGTWCVTVEDEDTFTFLLPSDANPPTPATGTITAERRAAGSLYTVQGRLGCSTGYALAFDPVLDESFEVERYGGAFPNGEDRQYFGDPANIGQPAGADMRRQPMNQGNGYRFRRYNHRRLILRFAKGPGLKRFQWRVDGGAWNVVDTDSPELGYLFVDVVQDGGLPLSPGSNHVIEFEAMDAGSSSTQVRYCDCWVDEGDWRDDATPPGAVIVSKDNHASSNSREAAVFGKRMYDFYRERPDIPRPDAVCWLVGDLGGDVLEHLPELQTDVETVVRNTAEGGREVWAQVEAVHEVASLTQTGGTATCVTADAHRYINGDSVVIEGADQEDYNGTHTITKINDTTFTFAVDSGATTPATGTITTHHANHIKATVAPGILSIIPHDASEGSTYRAENNNLLRKLHVRAYRRSGELVDFFTLSAKFKNWPIGPWTSDNIHLTIVTWDLIWRMIIRSIYADGLTLHPYSSS